MRRWFVVSLLLLLTACASAPAIQGGDDQAFSRTGRFAITVTEPGIAPQAVQGGFAWRDSGQTQRLDLANPMGSVLARVDVGPVQAVLTRSDGSRQVAPNADMLLQQVVGANIPVQGLKQWLQGRVTANVSQLTHADNGKPKAFFSNGWMVNLSRYDNQGPRLLVLERQDGPQRIRVRLVVDGV